MTKDKDFIELLLRFGPPPKVILLQCGNISNPRLKELLTFEFERAVKNLSFLDYTIIE